MKKMLLLPFLALILILAGCQDDVEEPVEHTEIVTALETLFDITDNSFTLEEETTLPNVLDGAILSWESDSSQLSSSSMILIPEEEETITVTVSIKKDGQTQTLDYSVTLSPTTTIDPVGDYRIIPDGRTTGGALVISGGNSSSNLQLIDDAFVEYGGGNDEIHILIVPTSSGGPTASAVSSMMNSYMGRYGITEDQFSVLNVTTTTKELADDPDEVAKVNNATAIWFTGGDQYRVTSSLWKDNGSASLVLQAMFDKWAAGNVVIGGSSAGAAIMSEVMIGGGLSVGALAYDHVEDRTSYTGDLYRFGAVQVNKTGFGFFDAGVIDQHFNTRDRLGRLIESAYVEGEQARGFGVAENSAIVYNNTTKDITIIGEMLIVDTRDATRTKTSTGLSRYENIKLSLLRGSSTYNVDTEEFNFVRSDGKPMEDITNEPGNQYLYPTNISEFALAGDSIYDFIANQLLDNRKDYLYVGRDDLPYGSHYTIADHTYYQDLNGTTSRIIYEKRVYFDASITTGFYDPTEREFSFSNVILDIIPLTDTMQELN